MITPIKTGRKEETSRSEPVKKKRLGELLLERGLITQKQLQHALEIQEREGGMLGQILANLKYVTEVDVVSALATQFGFPYLPLFNYEINPGVIKLIPESACRQYYLFPVDKMGNVLTVVMADPLNSYAVRDIEGYTRCSVQIFVSTPSDIALAINRFYGEKEMPNRRPGSNDVLGRISFLTTARKKEEEKKVK